MYIILTDPPKYPVHRIEEHFPNIQFFIPITEDQLPQTAKIVHETQPPGCTFTQKVVLDPQPQLIDGKYYTSYSIVDLQGDELQSAIFAKRNEYDSILQQHFDRVAQSKGYNGWITCSLRANKPGPFEQEGTAFFNWMEQCNVLCYQILEEVLTGVRSLPSPQEFTELLPPMQWPN